MDFQHTLRGALIAAGLAMMVDQTAAQSIGFARMPSRPAQYMGYGYGAGHHAPMVRAPGYPTPHVKHVTFAAARCGQLAPMAYEPVRCYGDSCYTGGPYVAVPAAASPIAAPPQDFAPAPAPDRESRRLFGY